jgi:hypothetical protein
MKLVEIAIAYVFGLMEDEHIFSTFAFMIGITFGYD